MNLKTSKPSVDTIKLIISHPFFLCFISGFLFNIAFFIQHPLAQITALFAIIPVFYAISKAEKKDRYWSGVFFFAPWMIPTTLWYYKIFPWYFALPATIGMVFLSAEIFRIRIASLFRKKGVAWTFFFFILTWVLFVVLRTTIPYVQMMYIPHIASTQWLNPSIIQISRILGLGGVIFLILLSNAGAAYLIIKKKFVLLAGFCLLIIASSLGGNWYLKNIESSSDNIITFIVVQSSPVGGYHSEAVTKDVELLKKMTLDELNKLDNRDDKTIIALWPENMVKAEDFSNVEEFVKSANIHLVYNKAEQEGEENPYNVVVILDPNGDEVMRNFKRHAAPGEDIKTKASSDVFVLNDIRITGAICYDLHFADVKKRAKGNDLLVGVVDDDRFGTIYPILHAADMVLRARENSINIITSSTNGPTFFVNKYGVVEKMPLELFKEETLVFERAF